MLFRIQDLGTGNFFVLAKNGELSADFNSTMFNSQDDLLGKYSFPGTMPLEPNRSNIRNLHYINTPASSRTINAMMWLDASPFQQAKMDFTIEDQQINYNLYFDLAIMANLLKTLNLNELPDPANDGQIDLLTPAALRDYMNATVTAAPGVYPMVFYPYKNDGAYVDAAYVLTPSGSPETVAYGVGVKFTWSNNRVYEVKTATSAGMTPITNADHFDDITVYPDIKLPASKIINRWQLDADGNGSFAVDNGFPISQTQAPAFYLVYVLKRIAQYFKFDFQSNWAKTEAAQRITFVTIIPLNYSTNIPDYSLQMPHILVTDFFKEIRSELGLMVDFDYTNRVLIVESLKKLETTDQVVDLQQLQTISFRETGTQSQAYVITQAYDDKDSAPTDFEKNNPAQLVIGDPVTAMQVTDVQLMSAATKMITEQSAVDITLAHPIVTDWRIPWIKMPMYGSAPMGEVSTVATADRNNYKMRFLYYHGMKEDSGGYLYPYASADNRDYANNVISDFTLSLSADSTAFLSIRHYFEFLQASKPFEMVFEMTPKQFMDIRNNKRIVVRDFNNAAVYAILDQNSADFANDKEVITAKLTLYPKIVVNNTVEIIPSEPPVVIPPPDNGVVYARLRQMNLTEREHVHPPPTYLYQDADYWVDFFADADGEHSKDVTDMSIRIQRVASFEFDGHTETVNYDFSADGTSYKALGAVLVTTADPTGLGGHNIFYEYTLMPSAHYTVI